MKITKQSKKIAKLVLIELNPAYKDIEIEDSNKSFKDVLWLLDYLEVAFILNEPQIYIDFINWLDSLLVSLKFDKNIAFKVHEKTVKVLTELGYRNYTDFLKDLSFDVIENPTKVNPYQVEKDMHLSLLLKMNKIDVDDYIMALVEQGVTLQSIYINILDQAMKDVGELWHQNKISVAVEHYCTIITQYISNKLYMTQTKKQYNNKVILTCTIGSELHELGIRMISDLLEVEGYNTIYLGANVPTKQLVDMLEILKPNYVALSTTMPHHLDQLRDTITSIKQSSTLKDIKVFVGGRPFINNDTLYQKVFADDYSVDAIDFIKKLELYND